MRSNYGASYTITAMSSWDDPAWGSGSIGSWDIVNPGIKKRKTQHTKHEYVSILLINSTVYNCKLCGIKKEDAKTEYCDNLVVPDDDFYIGDWG